MTVAVVYGIGSYERLYISTDRYWVSATIHRDDNECGNNTFFRYSEYAATILRGQVSHNSLVVSNSVWLSIHGIVSHDGNHIWDSNGWASIVTIP